MGAIDLNCLYSEKFSKLLERYELVKKIGEGGQAMVFQCRSKSGNREVFACKSIAKGESDVERISKLEDLRLEMEVMRKLDGHPGVVSLKEVIIDDDFWHLIMQLCECSLYDRIQNEGKLSEKESALLIQFLARTVQDLHANGVVHRDLKPGNVLITLGGEPFDVKVADFGLSVCFVGPCAPCFSEEVGTKRYYAPEILEGSYSKEVDIWGLGIILYEALTGMLAFEEMESDNIICRLRSGEDLAAPCLKWPTHVSGEAKCLVLAMMQQQPQKRLTCEQIVMHPWVIRHTGLVTQNRGAFVLTNLMQDKSCNRKGYKSKIKLQRVNGEWRVNSKSTCEVRSDGKKDAKSGKPERRKHIDTQRKEPVPKRLKFQMLNGAWQVVKPCAFVC